MIYNSSTIVDQLIYHWMLNEFQNNTNKIKRKVKTNLDDDHVNE